MRLEIKPIPTSQPPRRCDNDCEVDSSYFIELDADVVEYVHAYCTKHAKDYLRGFVERL